MRGFRKFATVVMWLCVVTAAFAQEAPKGRRPTVGLALGGGSARGLAHVGVLRWLEDHRVPVDYIAGTSMGSIIGGLYATGMTSSEIASALREADWDQFFIGDVPYADKSFRREQDAREYPVRLVYGLKGGFRLPKGLEPGHLLGMMLDRLTLPYSGVGTFDDLPIPYRAVATDLEKAERVVLKEGALPQAIRASMAIPGVFTPVIIDGKLLGDGGLLDNVPADVVRSMGADVVIAIDVGSKPVDRTYIQSFAGMLDQAITVMMVSRTREILSQADIIIAPELKSVKSTDWRKSDIIADLGYESTQTKERFLSTLTLDPDSWKAHLEERRKRARGEPQKIEFIIVEGAAAREQEYIRLKLSGFLGRPLDVPELEKDLTGIVGEGRYESMSYELTMEQGRTGLRVLVKEKSYGPPFGRFLLRVNNNRQGAMDAAFGTRLTFYDAGKADAELRVDLVAGSEQLAAAEYFYPLGRSRFFLMPRAGFNSRTQNAYAFGTRLADYTIHQVGGQADFGLQTSRRSQLTLGYGIGYADAKVVSGSPLLPSLSGRTTGAQLQWLYNRLNSPMIPSSGAFVASSVRWVTDSPGAAESYPIGVVQLGGFVPVGRKNTVFALFYGGTTFDRQPSSIDQFTLGGPFHLGAWDLDEFRGRNMLYVSPGYLRKIGRLPDFIGGNLYLGGWVEVGDAFYSFDTADFKVDASGGLLIESPLGPLFVGGSWGEGGQFKFNFALGTLMTRHAAAW
jgi:NTE family protein